MPPRKRNFPVEECSMSFVELYSQRENYISMYKLPLIKFNDYNDSLVICTSRSLSRWRKMANDDFEKELSSSLCLEVAHPLMAPLCMWRTFASLEVLSSAGAILKNTRNSNCLEIPTKHHFKMAWQILFLAKAQWNNVIFHLQPG